MYQLAEVIVQQIKIWVHIVAQPANRYIVAFHIAILIIIIFNNPICKAPECQDFRGAVVRYFTRKTGGSSQGKQSASTLVCTEVTIMMYSHLQTEIRKLFRIHGLM